MKIYDTTLRDGTQSAELNLSVQDKVEFALALDAFGVDYIELGWPGSNPKDMEAFHEISKRKLSHAKICAFGSTRKKDVSAGQDPNLLKILESKAPVATIFGKTWLVHVEKQLAISAEENLTIILESIAFLKKNNLEVIYDLEHFFDGFKDNKEYAFCCLETAARAGADSLILCDTNGGTLSSEIQNITNNVLRFLKRNNIKVELGIHCHNDRELGVANSLIVSKKMHQIQGTINGFGERAGNTNLSSVMPSLATMNIDFFAKKNLKELTGLSHLLYTLANVQPYPNQSFVGRNAFAHKAGVHVDAMMKGATYEFMDPNDVGNARNIVLSDLSGKANIVEMVKKFGFDIDKNDAAIALLLEKIKDMEKKGYDIAGIEAEQYLLAQQFLNKTTERIDIDFFEVQSFGRKITKSKCFVKAIVDSEVLEHQSEVSGGPVDALYHALQSLLEKKHPQVRNVELLNYKVRIAQQEGVSSSVRVYVEWVYENGKKEDWATVGVDSNILIASLEATKKGFEYYFNRFQDKSDH